MHPAFRSAADQTTIDKDGVIRWKETGQVVCDASLRKAGFTDPDTLRANEVARLEDFLKQHEDKT